MYTHAHAYSCAHGPQGLKISTEKARLASTPSHPHTQVNNSCKENWAGSGAAKVLKAASILELGELDGLGREAKQSPAWHGRGRAGQG